MQKTVFNVEVQHCFFNSTTHDFHHKCLDRGVKSLYNHKKSPGKKEMASDGRDTKILSRPPLSWVAITKISALKCEFVIVSGRQKQQNDLLVFSSHHIHTSNYSIVLM